MSIILGNLPVNKRKRKKCISTKFTKNQSRWKLDLVWMGIWNLYDVKISFAIGIPTVIWNYIEGKRSFIPDLLDAATAIHFIDRKTSARQIDRIFQIRVTSMWRRKYRYTKRILSKFAILPVLLFLCNRFTAVLIFSRKKFLSFKTQSLQIPEMTINLPYSWICIGNLQVGFFSICR